MSKWPLAHLGDICDINPKISRGVLSPDSLVSFLPMAAIAEDGGGIINYAERPYSEVAKGYTYFQNDDILFAKITPCMENGKAVIAKQLKNSIGFGSTEFHVIRCSPNVLPEWVFSFLRRPAYRGQARKNFTGTAGQQRLPADFVKNTLIPLPPLLEQERIVRLLDEADALRRLRQKADAHMADFIPALFHEMFGEQEFPSPFLRDIAEVVSGVAKGRRLGSAAVIVPYMRVANVQAGYLDLTEIKTIEALPSEVNELRLKKGDVLLTEGGDFDKLGRGALLEVDLPENCIHQNHVFRVRVQAEKLDPVYFSSYLQTYQAKGYFLQCAKKTTNLASINMTQLRGLPVPLPSLDLQWEFAARVNEARALQAAQSASAGRVEALFQSMLARAFAGEL